MKIQKKITKIIKNVQKLKKEYEESKNNSNGWNSGENKKNPIKIKILRIMKNKLIIQYSFITNNDNCNNCNEEEISDNFYKTPFKERLKRGKLEEDKKRPKPIKRKIIYSKDTNSDFSEKNNISDNDNPKKNNLVKKNLS